MCRLSLQAFSAPTRAFEMLEEVACKTKGVFRAPNYQQLSLCLSAYADDDDDDGEAAAGGGGGPSPGGARVA